MKRELAEAGAKLVAATEGAVQVVPGVTLWAGSARAVGEMERPPKKNGHPQWCQCIGCRAGR